MAALAPYIAALERIETIVENVNGWTRSKQRLSNLTDDKRLAAGIDHKYWLRPTGAEEHPVIAWGTEGQTMRATVTLELARFFGGGDAHGRDHQALVRALDAEADAVIQSLLMRRNWNTPTTGILLITLVSSGLLQTEEHAAIWGCDFQVVYRGCMDEGDAAGTYNLQFGPLHHALVGSPFRIYYDSVAQLDSTSDAVVPPGPLDHEDFGWRVWAPTLRGAVTEHADRWQFVPEAEDVGSHTIALRQLTAGRVTAQRTATLRVGQGAYPLATGRLLCVGDSLGNSDLEWPDQLDTLINLAGVTFVGSQGPTAQGNNHECRPGWSWADFATGVSSPMRSGGVIDIPNYVTTSLGGTPPTLVLWMLGINDCFTVQSGVPAAIAAMMANAESLLDAWRAAYPTVKHVLITTTTGTNYEPYYVSDYGGIAAYLADQYRWEVTHRQMYAAEIAPVTGWGDRESEGIYLAAISTAVDPTTTTYGNALHPNFTGNVQIGAAIYAALHWAVTH